MYHSGVLRQDDQTSEQLQYPYEGKESKLLAFLHERPEFHHEIAHMQFLLTSTDLKLVFHMGRGLGIS